MTPSGQMALHEIVATRRRRFIKHVMRIAPTRLARLANGHRMETKRRQKRNWKTKEDMTRHTERRTGGDGHGLERQDDCCQRSCQLETNHQWSARNGRN